MSKIKTLLISLYLFGVVGNTIYLHFFHSFWKHKGLAFNIGMSLAWPIAEKYSTPILVWIIIIALAVLVTFADEIATEMDKQNNSDKDN